MGTSFVSGYFFPFLIFGQGSQPRLILATGACHSSWQILRSAEMIDQSQHTWASFMSVNES